MGMSFWSTITAGTHTTSIQSNEPSTTQRAPFLPKEESRLFLNHCKSFCFFKDDSILVVKHISFVCTETDAGTAGTVLARSPHAITYWQEGCVAFMTMLQKVPCVPISCRRAVQQVALMEYIFQLREDDKGCGGEGGDASA